MWFENKHIKYIVICNVSNYPKDYKTTLHNAQMKVCGLL